MAFQTQPLPDVLWGEWVHAYEEDSADLKVYRPADYDFPPARGRERFKIEKEGVFLHYGIAPNDGYAKPARARWKLRNDGSLDICFPAKEQEDYQLELVEVSAERLVLRKTE